MFLLFSVSHPGTDVPIQCDLLFESEITELESNMNERLSVYNDEQRTLQVNDWL